MLDVRRSYLIHGSLVAFLLCLLSVGGYQADDDLLIPGHPTFVVLGKPHNFTDAVRACATTQLLDGVTVMAPMAQIYDSVFNSVAQAPYLVTVLRERLTPVSPSYSSLEVLGVPFVPSCMWVNPRWCCLHNCQPCFTAACQSVHRRW